MMTQFTRRGVPHSIASDGWWLQAAPDGRTSAPVAPVVEAPAKKPVLMWPLAVALVLVVCADILLQPNFGGLSLAVLSAFYAGGIVVCFAPGRRRAISVGVAALATTLPMLSFYQPLSLAWWGLGLVVMPALAAGVQPKQMLGFLYRWPWNGLSGLAADLTVSGRGVPQGGQIKQALRQWGLAVGLGILFLGLFSIANPLIGSWLEGAVDAIFDVSLSARRIGVWLLTLGGLVLAASARFVQLPKAALEIGNPLDRLNLTARPLINALIVFNLIFALQLVSDLSVFVFNSGLPEGMSFASYAHRGAYPLVATALLAGAFMVLAGRHIKTAPILGLLLKLWWIQNLVLLGTAAYRLVIYVEAYGLTYLRLHAGIWMGLVCFGLVVVAYDLWQRKGEAWIVSRCAIAVIVVLYTACFVNFGAIVTASNLNNPESEQRIDWGYLDQIGISGQAEYVEFMVERVGGYSISASNRYPITNWRNFDFRRWSINRSIDQTLTTARAEVQP